MSNEMKASNDQTQVKDLLDTTKNYEKLSFMKGVAGLYYRAALTFSLGLFGLIILQGLDTDPVFYDKGLFGMADNFTITEVGIIVVMIAFLGDISFAFVRFITDQRYTEYLEQKDRATIVRNFSLGSVVMGVLFATATILLAVFNTINEAQAWALIGLFIGGLFLLLGKTTTHPPTLFFGGMLTLASVLIAFEPIPGPYWLIMMMVFSAGAYIAAISSYLFAQRQF